MAIQKHPQKTTRPTEKVSPPNLILGLTLFKMAPPFLKMAVPLFQRGSDARLNDTSTTDQSFHPKGRMCSAIGPNVVCARAKSKCASVEYHLP